jgi:NhaP-type Na+/H+ or K+/H+ antiporter
MFRFLGSCVHCVYGLLCIMCVWVAVFGVVWRFGRYPAPPSSLSELLLFIGTLVWGRSMTYAFDEIRKIWVGCFWLASLGAFACTVHMVFIAYVFMTSYDRN